MHKFNKRTADQLYRAILTLKTEEEVKRFLDDAFTIQELEAIAQRLNVACLLCDGRNYVEINKETGASTATICRVSKCLNYGEGGYKTVISRLKEGVAENA